MGARSRLTIRTGASGASPEIRESGTEIYRDQDFLEPCVDPGMIGVGEGVLTLTR
jgi:hypothetical protein